MLYHLISKFVLFLTLHWEKNENKQKEAVCDPFKNILHKAFFLNFVSQCPTFFYLLPQIICMLCFSVYYSILFYISFCTPKKTFVYSMNSTLSVGGKLQSNERKKFVFPKISKIVFAAKFFSPYIISFFNFQWQWHGVDAWTVRPVANLINILCS